MDFDNAITALHPGEPDDGDEGRKQRGLAIAALVPIEKKQLGYKVPSQSGNGAYIVNVDNEALCSCPDFEKRAAPCKHIYAVWMVEMRRVTPDGGVVKSRAVGRDLHPGLACVQRSPDPREEALSDVAPRSLRHGGTGKSSTWDGLACQWAIWPSPTH